MKGRKFVLVIKNQMVQVSLKNQIAELPERLQKEWSSICYSSKTDIHVFEEFKSRWEQFQGTTIEEFLNVSNSVYIQWKDWKYKNGYNTDFKSRYNSKDKTKCDCIFIDEKSKRCDHTIKSKSFTEVWNEFKLFWELDSEESKVMFKEMELLSVNMLGEWRMKYNFDYPHVYEKDNNHWSCVERDYRLKSKVQLWNEFKEIWDIDIDDYNEDKYKEMNEYVSEIECDSEDYFKDYPTNFYEYREDANYHSFDSYSLIEQFEICEDWERHRQDGDIEERESEE